MTRDYLTDQQWEHLRSHLPPQKPKTGRPPFEHRQILNGILWILRKSCTLARPSSRVWLLEGSNEPRRERLNRGLYRERNRVERLINRLKQFRAFCNS